MLEDSRHPAAGAPDDRRRQGNGRRFGDVVAGLPGDGHSGRTSRGRAAQRRARAGRSLRHPLHLGDDRRAEGRRDDARPHADRGHGLGGHDRPPRRRRLPAGESVLPHVRPQGRHPRQCRQRRHHAARARLRRRPGPGPRRRRARHGPARAADALPIDPRPPAARAARPLVVAGGGDRLGRHPRGADPPGRRRASLLEHRHRLRAHRGGHRLRHVRRTTTPRPSPPPWAGRGRASSCASSATTATTSGPGSRARWSSAGAASWRAISTTPRRRGRCCRRTAGCAPGTSAS